MDTPWVLAAFTAPWSAPCRVQSELVDQIRNSRPRLQVLDIDITEHPELATRFMVQSIPTLILFERGKERKRFIGLKPGQQITQALDNLISNNKQPQGGTP